jgi:hypothetical protein
LILTWNPEIVHNVGEGSDNLGSDHFSICFAIPVSKQFEEQPKRSIYNFKRADWNGLKHALASDPWLSDTSDIDSMWTSWFQNYTKIVDKFIPKISCKCRNSAPWIDPDIIKLVKKKERAWIKFKKTGNATYYDKFHSLRKKSKKLIKQKRADFISELSSSLKDNPKRFWSFYKVKHSSKLPHVISYKSNSSDKPIEQASLFNGFFNSVFRKKCVENNNY